MILLTHQSRILVGIECADFRKGLDGFIALCRHQIQTEPNDQTIFVFRNRSYTMIRALCYDGSGYWLMTKRLSKGKFTYWPRSDEPLSAASARQLHHIINAQDWQKQPVDKKPVQYASTSTTVNLSHPLNVS